MNILYKTKKFFKITIIRVQLLKNNRHDQNIWKQITKDN